MVDHTVRARKHDGFVTILRPYPVRGCASWTQHLNDLNDTVMLPDDATMNYKPITFASVHDTVLPQSLGSVSRLPTAYESHKQVNHLLDLRCTHSRTSPATSRILPNDNWAMSSR